MSLSKQAKLDQIAAEIVMHNICPDLAKTAKHLVPGEGNPNANVIFVGEAPGKNEDETGRPFVGAAGKFLDQLLESIGLARSEVFITSIVKYRPPNNRDPRPDEKAAFLPYLQAQIAVIQPRVIVALGRHGAGCFFPDVVISRDHGKPRTWQGYTVVLVYHPAAVLYQRSLQPTLFDDFRVIQDIIRNTK